MKQKGRAGGGRKKKPQPPSREGTPEQVKGSPAGAAAAAPGAEGTQASPSPSPDVEGGRTGNPFEEEEREAVRGFSACDLLTACLKASVGVWPDS